jgi:hypothetical protein
MVDAASRQGSGPLTAELFRSSELGPCKAEVIAESVELASGAIRFRVTETWHAPRSLIGCRFCDNEATAELYDSGDTSIRIPCCELHAERVLGATSGIERAVVLGTLTEITMVESSGEAIRAAASAAREWRQGSKRHEQLAPNGKLRAG